MYCLFTVFMIQAILIIQNSKSSWGSSSNLSATHYFKTEDRHGNINEFDLLMGE